MVYAVTTAILIVPVVIFFFWSRSGLSSFGRLQWVLRLVAAAPLLLSGSAHFVRTALYAGIIPPWIPYHYELVLLSGVLELAGAVGLLLPQCTRAASACLTVLMIVIFPANVYVAGHMVGGMHMPGVPVRLALQVIYMVLLLAAGWGLPVALRRQASTR